MRIALDAMGGDHAPIVTVEGAVRAARLYGIEGSGARDPRTGVSAARLKDVLGGDLDRFLEAWRAREGGSG